MKTKSGGSKKIDSLNKHFFNQLGRQTLFIGMTSVLMLSYQNCAKQQFEKYSTTTPSLDLNGNNQVYGDEADLTSSDNTVSTPKDPGPVPGTVVTRNQNGESVVVTTMNDGSKEITIGTVPLSGQTSAPKMTTVAFEDWTPINDGDKDFNDFVYNFNVIEKLNEKNELTSVEVIYEPKFKESASDHSLSLYLKGGCLQEDKDSSGKPMLSCSQSAFYGDYQVQRISDFRINESETLTNQELSPDKVVVFASTNYAIHNIKKVVVNIKLLNPELNIRKPSDGIDIRKYRTAMKVPSKNGYVYLDVLDMNVDAIRLHPNQSFGLFVPGDWVPVESGSVFWKYPKFQGHMNFLIDNFDNKKAIEAEDTKNWFLNF